MIHESMFISLSIFFFQVVLLWSIYQQINCKTPGKTPDNCGICQDTTDETPKEKETGQMDDSGRIMCWETYLAQQLWRIIIVNFLFECLVALIVEPFRNLLGL